MAFGNFRFIYKYKLMSDSFVHYF